MTTRRYPDPQEWRFNEEDRRIYHRRYWRCPVRLVCEGLWAKLWRIPQTTRGGGAITCLLPVLALHTWPERDGATGGWTGWAYLSRRRMAALAGINKDTATHAIRQLVRLGLMEIERRPRAKYEGGYKTYYRLAAPLYPQADDEPYATIPGALLYGGTWFLLPSPACRQLYVVLACLDPIGDEDAYLERIATAIGDEWSVFADRLDIDLEEFEDDEELEATVKATLLAQRRESAVVSLSEIEGYAGLQRSTVIEAIQVLTTPMFGNEVIDGKTYPPIPLIVKGPVPPRTPTWYAPDRRAWGWAWNSGLLNTPEQVEARRQQLWPYFFRHQRKTKRRGIAYCR
jgi:hypothetical protein